MYCVGRWISKIGVTFCVVFARNDLGLHALDKECSQANVLGRGIGHCLLANLLPTTTTTTSTGLSLYRGDKLGLNVPLLVLLILLLLLPHLLPQVGEVL